MAKAKALEGEVLKSDDYDKVMAVRKKSPELGIMAACAEAGVDYQKFNYFRNKIENGRTHKAAKKAPKAIKAAKNGRPTIPTSTMQTYTIDESQVRSKGNGKVVALIGSGADIADTLREMLGGRQ